MDYFRQVPDYRSGRKTKHDHVEMLMCVTIGFLCGRTTIRRSLKWCCANIQWLRQFMPLKNGIASPATVSRMLRGIDEQLFLYAFMEWIGEIVNTRDTHLAIDGKALRGATERVKMRKTPLVMNVIEVPSGLVVAQLPIEAKENEIVAIPRILNLLDISGSTVTIDAIGTQITIMDMIHDQGGYFVLEVKMNQPEACEEIHEFMDEMGEAAKNPEAVTDSVQKEYLKKYGEVSTAEKNRDRYEYRECRICNDASELTKSQKEWKHVKSLGQIRQVRIPIERDLSGNDITPSKEDFLKSGSGRVSLPSNSGAEGKDIQKVALVSNRSMSAEELGRIKRMHWSIENQLHHVLDESFREDRSPAKVSRNNLALIRKFVYNILRLAMLEMESKAVMTEMMDAFCDNAKLRQKYIFEGITALY